MNRAHSTHYTLFPIQEFRVRTAGARTDRPHVKRASATSISATYPPTSAAIGGEAGGRCQDGNSIFIFEVAGLCIGHLGHLHHKLDDTHFAAIGRLDIVMVPIDGTYTMSLDGVSEITRRLRSSVVLPMHASPPRSIIHAPDRPAIRHRPAHRADPEDFAETLPGTPTVIILEG
jgi:L-ascorbate metabolism protein UlaG (beta-lactamase superfamily)